ncbi:MAG: tetratricopeptide repeat protein [Oscillibacter sp.]|nr:tetratricopeptide repeat protein [Oscillibacter sp.]
MRKQIIILAGLFVLLLTACGGTNRTWQEQYDLGIRYLSEGNYEEAIIAFTTAIEIDPKQPLAYIGRGSAYFSIGELDKSEADYLYAQKLNSDLDIQEQLDAISHERNALILSTFKETMQPIVELLDIPFTVDNIVLGETGITVAKNTYGSRPYALSNLMNDDTEDTVYTCFGMNDMPIPNGYEVNEFGFLFSEPVGGGGIDHIVICDTDFTCMGSLHIGDSKEAAFSYFGFSQDAPLGEVEWTLLNGASLIYVGDSANDFSLLYQITDYSAKVYVKSGLIHRIIFDIE